MHKVCISHATSLTHAWLSLFAFDQDILSVWWVFPAVVHHTTLPPRLHLQKSLLRLQELTASDWFWVLVCNSTKFLLGITQKTFRVSTLPSLLGASAFWAVWLLLVVVHMFLSRLQHLSQLCSCSIWHSVQCNTIIVLAAFLNFESLLTFVWRQGSVL